jgi:hypothetical protein
VRPSDAEAIADPGAWWWITNRHRPCATARRRGAAGAQPIVGHTRLLTPPELRKRPCLGLGCSLHHAVAADIRDQPLHLGDLTSLRLDDAGRELADLHVGDLGPLTHEVAIEWCGIIALM